MENRVKHEVGDQLNADFNYLVKEQGIKVYEKVSQEPVDDSKLDVDDLIDKECSAKSEALEEVIRNKEQLMVDYFKSLMTGNIEEVERIKKLIKDVSDKVYEEFLIDIDKKIIDVLKTLDMEKLIKERKENDVRYETQIESDIAEEEIQPNTLTIKEDSMPTVQPIDGGASSHVHTYDTAWKPTDIPMDDDEGLEEGIYNPNHSQNREFILSKLGVNICKTPSEPVTPTTPKYDSIQEEMIALGISAPKKDEPKYLDTIKTEKGRTATLDLEGRIINIDGVDLDFQIFNLVNIFKGKTPDEGYELQVESNKIKEEREKRVYDDVDYLM